MIWWRPYKKVVFFSGPKLCVRASKRIPSALPAPPQHLSRKIQLYSFTTHPLTHSHPLGGVGRAASKCLLPCLHCKNGLLILFFFVLFFLAFIDSFSASFSIRGAEYTHGVEAHGVHGEVKVTPVEKVMLSALRESPLSIADCPQPILLQGLKFA